MEQIIFQGVPVYYKRMKASRHLCRSKHRENNAVCPLSEDEIHLGNDIYLVLNNWSLFDNCFVKADAVDKLGWPEAIAQIKRKFDNFVNLHRQLAPYVRLFGQVPVGTYSHKD